MDPLVSNSFDWSIIKDLTFCQSFRIRNKADRDDAIQDAFVKLRAHPSVTPPLLRATIVNCHKDRVKADQRRTARERSRHMGVREASDDWLDTDDNSSSVGPRRRPRADDVGLDHPSARLQRQETRRAIKRAVRAARLSRKHRCALLAWMRDGVAEFASRRGVKAVTVRVWAKRAIDALRPHLEREGIYPD